jgi:aryl-alcohol dehydrogenase-like predicted oxidoreductase
MTTNTITLNNGVTMPALGLGVFQTPPDETRTAVEAALWDTANIYAYGTSEEIVGRAIKKYAKRDDVGLAEAPGHATRPCPRAWCLLGVSLFGQKRSQSRWGGVIIEATGGSPR